MRLKNQKACIGDSFKFNAQIRNISNSNVAIDRDRIWSVVTFKPLSPARKTGRLEESVIWFGRPTHYKPRFYILKPLQTLSVEGDLPVERGQMRAGKYQLRLGYEQFFDDVFQGIQVRTGIAYSNKQVAHILECANQDERTVPATIEE